MSKKITATIANTEDEKIRLNVGEPIMSRYGRQVAEPRWATGISLDAVYVGRKWLVIETDSAWESIHGRRTGTSFTAYDMTSALDRKDILRLCDKLGIDVPAAADNAEDA